MKKPFQMICALWVTPDFSQVLAGKVKPPRVNHSNVNFEALAQALQSAFHFGPPVTIRVPNDTIDQVTVHFRMSGAQDQLSCKDFSAKLLACTKKQTGRVIDVREAWRPLHKLQDRDFAPPPSLLQFVVEAADFEDAIIWQASTAPVLGLPPFNMATAMNDSSPKAQHSEGALPKELRQHLHQIFGSPFETPCLMDRLAHDKVPSEYAHINGG